MYENRRTGSFIDLERCRNDRRNPRQKLPDGTIVLYIKIPQLPKFVSGTCKHAAWSINDFMHIKPRT
jgi:hypothetical protein